jgi:hypothetical protein
MMNTDCTEKISADDIAEKVLSGEDIAQYFTNRGVMKPAVNLITVDIGSDMLSEIDNLAAEMNISRQAIIKVYLRQSLDQHYLAKKYK